MFSFIQHVRAASFPWKRQQTPFPWRHGQHRLSERPCKRRCFTDVRPLLRYNGESAGIYDSSFQSQWKREKNLTILWNGVISLYYLYSPTGFSKPINKPKQIHPLKWLPLYYKSTIIHINAWFWMHISGKKKKKFNLFCCNSASLALVLS